MNCGKHAKHLFFTLFFSLLLLPGKSTFAQNNCAQFDIIGGLAPKGDCIWVPVRIINFDTVLAVQFGLAYDPLVIRPVEKWANPTLVGLDTMTNINFDGVRKLVRFLWTNPNGDCSGLKDGDTLIMIKFQLIGEPGSCTSINFFNRSPIQNEVLDCNADEICFEEINPQDNEICITAPVDLCVVSYSCGTLTNSGNITIIPYGGTPPYTVTRVAPPQVDVLANSGDRLVYNNLFPGMYMVRVQDATGKDTILNITIGNADAMAIFANGIKQPRCWNTNDGEINIRITGGSGPLVIGWRPIDIYGPTTVTKLGVGTYTVTVRDSAGCLATEDFVLFADTLNAEVDVIKDASCKDDGAAVARGIGGNPYPGGLYDYFWSQNVLANSTDTASYNYRLSGKQFVIVNDSRGCADTVFFEIPFGGNLIDSIVIDSIKCFGDSTGRINSFVSSLGTLNIPLLFRLTDINNNTIFGGANGVDNYVSPLLKAGTYYLEITDTSGCQRKDTIVITQPPKLEILENSLDTIESCNPGMDAFINVRGFGGAPTYNFVWSNMVVGPVISNVSAGSYTVTVTDFNGCSATKAYTITRPAGIRIDSISSVGPNCAGDFTGSAEVFYTAGSSPLSKILWSNGSMTSKINNIREGNYSVIVTDQNGCEDTATVNILPAGNALRINSTVIRDPRCNGDADGFIVVTVSGGQAPYSYLWDNGEQTPNNTNLKAGRHCIRIDDMGNCPPLDTCFTLVDPPAIGVNLTQVTPPSCSTPGTCDATAIVTISCLDTVNSLTWSSGEQVFTSRDTATRLCSGEQYVIATCGFCADTLIFNVPEAVPIAIDSNFLSVTAPRCYQSNDGQISIQAKGGTKPYQYNWVNPAVNSNTINGLGDGTYYVRITDSLNCVHFDSVRLREPDSIRVDIILGSTLDVSCPGLSDGRIVTAWTGGNRSKATFNWNPNVSVDSIATNLPAGNYRIQVTDEKGCTGVVNYQINEPPPITFITSPLDTPFCKDDQIAFTIQQANGGAGPSYRFTVNNGAPTSINNDVFLFAGTYNVRIYDKNNCFVDTSITVIDPGNILALDFGRSFDTIQLGDSILLDGHLISSSGLGTVTWSPSNTISNTGSTISFATPNKTTTYDLTVVDINGCETSDQITIVVRSTRRFYAPNVFSPNGDNINDQLEAYVGQGVQAIRSVQIYDRWGNLVSQSINPPINGERVNLWNGRFGQSGDQMNPGVFIYVADILFQDGSSIIYRGDITLLR